MKKYNVTVNGNLYQVEVEEVKGEFAAAPIAPISPAAPVQTVQVPQAQATAATLITPEEPEVKATPKVSSASGVKIESPMPGTIVKVAVKNGSTVKQGDVLFVLEAMKMENEIMSPIDGTVVEVNVIQGAIVNTGDILGVIA